MPLWVSALLGLMLLDLIGAYLPHWVEHRIKPLWMIHLVHHCPELIGDIPTIALDETNSQSRHNDSQ